MSTARKIFAKIRSQLPVHGNFVTFAITRKDYIMSEGQMNSYRLTSMEEPGDERMARIMLEVAEDARESTRRTRNGGK